MCITVNIHIDNSGILVPEGINTCREPRLALDIGLSFCLFDKPQLVLQTNNCFIAESYISDVGFAYAQLNRGAVAVFLRQARLGRVQCKLWQHSASYDY